MTGCGSCARASTWARSCGSAWPWRKGMRKRGAATRDYGQLGSSSTATAVVGRGARAAPDPQGETSWGRARAGLKQGGAAETGVCRARTRMLVASRLQ
jgi:hypothetical protein